MRGAERWLPATLACAAFLVMFDAAADSRAALLPMHVDKAIAPAWRETFRDRVIEGLSRSKVRASDGTAAVRKAGGGACADPRCRAAVVEATGARYVVVATVEVRGEADYDLRVEALDPRDATRSAAVTDRCEVCGLGEVADRLADQAALLGTKIQAFARAVPTVSITSVPTGADVRLDGAPIGATPVSRRVEPGDHTVRAEKRGFAPAQRRFQAVVGADERIEFRLEQARRDAPKGFVPAGWTLVGVGIAGAVVGSVLLAVDNREFKGRCSDTDVDTQGNCRFLHDTKVGGAIALATGGAAIVVGAVLLGVARKRERARRRPSHR